MIEINNADEALKYKAINNRVCRIDIAPLVAEWEEKYGRKLTQKQLQASVDVSQPALSGWMNGYYHQM
ncbi:MAG: hypothetical protein AAFN11_22290, partial [Chloroflexota bacterium]